MKVRRGGREKNDYLVMMVIRMVWFFTGRPNLESGGCFAVHWTFCG